MTTPPSPLLHQRFEHRSRQPVKCHGLHVVAQMRQRSVPDAEAAGALKGEIALITEAIAHADRLMDVSDHAVPDMLEGTDRSLGAIDRAMMARGYM